MYSADYVEDHYKENVEDIRRLLDKLDDYAEDMMSDDIWDDEDCDVMNIYIDHIISKSNDLKKLFSKEVEKNV